MTRNANELGNGPTGPASTDASLSPIGATGPAGPAHADDVDHDDLAEWSDHSLYYELDMLHRVRDLRRKTAALVESVGEEWQQTIENVFVEDFEIHVRILVEFFAKPEPREDRARLVHAVDFLGAAQEANWRRKHVSSNEEQELDRLWDLVSEHALHPMRSRTHDRDKKKIDFDATVALLDRLATAFVFAPGVFKKLSRRRDWSRWHSRVVVDPR